MDANDHDPAWLNPPEINTTITVSAGSPTGSVVARVRATDLDVGENARLKYTFHRDENNQEVRVLPFRVDPDTGSIIVSEDLIPILRSSENVTFVATLVVQDHGVPPRRSNELRRLTVIVTRRAPVVTSPGFLSRYGNGGAMSELIGNGVIVAVAAAIGTGIILLLAALGVVWCVMHRRRRQSRKDEWKSRATKAQQRSQSDDTCKNNCRVESLKAVTIKDSQRKIHQQQDECLLRKSSMNVVVKDGSGTKPDILDCFDDKRTSLSDGDQVTSSSFISSQYDDVIGGYYTGRRPVVSGCHGMTTRTAHADFNTFPSRVNIHCSTVSEAILMTAS